MPQFDSISPTTELEAVNEMFAEIGEPRIDQGELDTPTQADTEMAIDLFLSTMRSVLGEGWRFNTEWGYEISPTGDSPYSWTDTEGTTTNLNIFAPPSNLLSWDLTQTDDQMTPPGDYRGSLDLVIRPPRDYSGTASEVFYDRNLNRDGLDEDDFSFLYINPTWFWDFEDCPQTFRTYVTIVAARRFAKSVMTDGNIERLSRQDEVRALRNLRSDQGAEDENVNMFDNAREHDLLYRHRRRRGSTFRDRRDSPGLSS